MAACLPQATDADKRCVKATEVVSKTLSQLLGKRVSRNLVNVFNKRGSQVKLKYRHFSANYQFISHDISIVASNS